MFVLISCDEKKSDDSQQTLARVLFQATVAMDRLEYEHALALVDSAARIDDHNASIMFFRARVLSELGDYGAAEKAYLKVKDFDAKYRGVWNNLGNLSYEQSKFRDAASYYQQELAENDTAFLAWRGLGRAYGEMGLVDSAKFALDQAILINPGFAGSYYSEAILYEHEGDFDRALTLAGKATQLAPQSHEYRFLYGSLLIKNGKPAQAIPQLKQVVEAWPWHNGALYNLGQAYARTGDEKLAQKYLDQAEKARALQAQVALQQQGVVTYNREPMAYAKLGSALRMSGRYDEALRAYKIALHLAPDNYEIENNMANLYLIKDDTLAAISHYKSILDRDPTLVDIWLNLGVVEVLRGNTQAAREAWQSALRHDPNNRQAISYLSRLGRARQ